MKFNAVTLVLIFSISIFAGCIEGGSSAGDREKISSLELEINYILLLQILNLIQQMEDRCTFIGKILVL